MQGNLCLTLPRLKTGTGFFSTPMLRELGRTWLDNVLNNSVAESFLIIIMNPELCLKLKILADPM